MLSQTIFIALENILFKKSLCKIKVTDITSHKSFHMKYPSAVSQLPTLLLSKISRALRKFSGYLLSINEIIVNSAVNR